MLDLSPPGRREQRGALPVESRPRAFRRRHRPRLRTLALRLALAVAAVWTIAFGIGVVLH